jgi:hypothetical protein
MAVNLPERAYVPEKSRPFFNYKTIPQTGSHWAERVDHLLPINP